MKLRLFALAGLLAVAGVATAATFQYRVVSPGVVSVTPLVLGAFSIPTLSAGSAAVALTPPSSNSGGSFTYSSSDPSVASVSGNMLTPVSGGTATITATQAAYGLIPSGSTTATVTVLYSPTMGALSLPSTVYAGGSAFTLTQPTSNSTGAFTYSSSNPSVASVSGTQVTPLTAGTTTITATQAAAGAYAAATTSAVLTVQPAMPTVAWAAPNNPGITVGADGLTLTIPSTNYGMTPVNTAGKKSSGKWYWEITVTVGSPKNVLLGIHTSTGGYLGGVYAQDNTGTNGAMCGPGYCNAGATAGFTYAVGDTVGFAYDTAGSKLSIYRNNVKLSSDVSTSGYTGAWGPAVNVTNTMTGSLSLKANFGSSAFKYTPPTGYTKLEP